MYPPPSEGHLCSSVPHRHLIHLYRGYMLIVRAHSRDRLADSCLPARVGFKSTSFLFLSMGRKLVSKSTAMHREDTRHRSLPQHVRSGSGVWKEQLPASLSRQVQQRVAYFRTDHSLGAAHWVAQWARWKTMVYFHQHLSQTPALLLAVQGWLEVAGSDLHSSTQSSLAPPFSSWLVTRSTHSS